MACARGDLEAVLRYPKYSKQVRVFARFFNGDSFFFVFFNRMDNFASAKRKSGQVLRSKERQIVVNVFNYLKRLNPDKSVNWIVSETAEATGISKTSVFKIRTESVRGPLVTPSKKRQSNGVRRNSRKVK
jgi:hypothetical protein